MEKKRVGVITFHNYDNYGAILQSYALQKKLREIGTQPEIIDYRCDYISNPFRLVNLKKKGLFNYIYGAIVIFATFHAVSNATNSVSTCVTASWLPRGKCSLLPANTTFILQAATRSGTISLPISIPPISWIS